MNKMEYMPVDCLLVPKMLFQMEKYKNLSNTAKILYSLFLDRLKFAVQKMCIRDSYEGYIIKLSTRKLYDESGQVHYCIDETLRRRLETKLITKILAFEVA